mmetsp:Transcript_1477/g.3574  ORF Transcript_1477/g.3574 Transcript_1477/m.3574 type:complete len:206 (+) Transcript_1477:250-867(+)
MRGRAVPVPEGRPHDVVLQPGVRHDGGVHAAGTGAAGRQPAALAGRRGHHEEDGADEGGRHGVRQIGAGGLQRAHLLRGTRRAADAAGEGSGAAGDHRPARVLPANAQHQRRCARAVAPASIRGDRRPAAELPAPHWPRGVFPRPGRHSDGQRDGRPDLGCAQRILRLPQPRGARARRVHHPAAAQHWPRASCGTGVVRGGRQPA